MDLFHFCNIVFLLVIADPTDIMNIEYPMVFENQIIISVIIKLIGKQQLS